MPDEKAQTVVCRRGPRSLPGGRIIAVGESAEVDPTDAQVADAIERGDLVVEDKPAKRRSASKGDSES